MKLTNPFDIAISTAAPLIAFLLCGAAVFSLNMPIWVTVALAILLCMIATIQYHRNLQTEQLLNAFYSIIKNTVTVIDNNNILIDRCRAYEEIIVHSGMEHYFSDTPELLSMIKARLAEKCKTCEHDCKRFCNAKTANISAEEAADGLS